MTGSKISNARAKGKALKAGVNEWEMRPLAFQFSEPPDFPQWIVERRFERRTVNVISGDTGAAKSIIGMDLCVATCMKRDWLDFKVHAERILVVDEENPESLVKGRLRALGMTDEAKRNLVYFNRLGTRLGDSTLGHNVARWDKQFRVVLADFRPDAIIIDTAQAATAAKVNDNDEVVTLYAQTLRPYAEHFNLTVIILHHERKRGGQLNDSYNTSQAMMGARQWEGQADTHMTISKIDTEEEESQEKEGWVERTSTFYTTLPKERNGAPDIKHKIKVWSEVDDSSRLWRMTVDNTGVMADELMDMNIKHHARQMTRLVVMSDNGGVRASEMADEIDVETNSRNFRKARDYALSRDWIEQVKRGIYQPGSTPLDDEEV